MFNQKGFSLPEILVAVGLLGGVSLVSMKLMDQQSGNDRTLKSKSEINKAVALVIGAISNDASCKNLLAGLNPGTTPGSEINITSLRQSVRAVDGSINLMELLKTPAAAGAVENYGAFHMQFGDIKLRVVSVNPAGTNTANIIMNFRVRKNGVKANYTTDASSKNLDDIYTRTIPVEYKARTTAPLGQIVSCGPVLSEANELARKKFCASLDPNENETDLTVKKGVAYWDDANKKCNLNSMDCPWGQVPKEMTSLGGVQCVPIENTLNKEAIEQFFDPTPCRSTSGSFTIEQAGSKLIIKCN
jgi:prepilin-type N-terminal cleavage/methylation domain-containing protein